MTAKESILTSVGLLLLFIYFIYACPVGFCTSCASDCQDYQDKGHTKSGVYHVTPVGTRRGFDVYCDMATDDGGWLVFQRRLDGSGDFYKNWTDYEGGFGDKNHEHWLGLLPLKRILSQGHYELRIDLTDFEGNSAYAKYESFDIGDLAEKYILKVTRYSGTAGDSLYFHNGRMFSTNDKDNDIDARHCAREFKGAWWYSSCHLSNLNGQYLNGSYLSFADGINWYTWKGLYYSVKTTDMKIRRV